MSGRATVEQLVQARGPVTPLCVGDAVEALLHGRDAGRVCIERVREPTDVTADLSQADDEVAQLGGGCLELRGEPLERRQSVFGGSRERPGALALVGIERRCGRMGAVAELRDVAEALALGTKRLLLPRLQPVRVLDQRLELVQPRALGVGAVLQLLDAPPGRDEAAPRLPGLLPPRPLRRPGERVEQVELVRRPREPPLRELAGEREQPVGRGDEVVACHAAAPRVGARAPVGANAAGDDEPRLVVRPEVVERLEAVLVEEALRHVELRLHVGLRARRADEPRVTFRPEQQPDRLREDRLPGARLAGERDEPRRQLELGLADEDEVLDPQPAQHIEDRSSGHPSAQVSGTAGLGGEALAVPAHEGRVRQGCEERAGGAQAHGDPASRRGLPDPVPVHEHGHRHLGRAVPDDDVLAARDDERPRVERVRRDERRRHRVDTPHQHRAAVREVVRGRAGRASSR